MIAILFFAALWDHSHDCSIRFTYDSNIFGYSSEYIDDFINQIRSYRFPFETYDDLCTEANLNFRIRNRFFGNHTTTFNCGFQVRHYAINEEKDFQRIIAGLRQSFGAWAIKGSYRVAPGYVIRYYRDPAGEYTDYQTCEVTYHTITGKLNFPGLAFLEPVLVYDYSIDDYIDAFDMYDAHGHTIGMQADMTLSKTFVTWISYDFKTSTLNTAATIDPDVEEPVPDGAYFQHGMKINALMYGFASLPVSLMIEYGYSFRNYRSDSPDDRMHFGRHDHQHTILLESEVKVRTGMVFAFGYTHTLRRTTSEVFPDIDTIKNFNKERLSAGLEFYY